MNVHVVFIMCTGEKLRSAEQGSRLRSRGTLLFFVYVEWWWWRRQRKVCRKELLNRLLMHLFWRF